MRQVPQYLIIGDGRVARHFQQYFTLLQLSFKVWHRAQSLAELNQLISNSSHILLLISDIAIEDFIERHLTPASSTIIHFSGSLISQQAYGAHPLMSFSHEIYTKDQYLTIPFIVDHDAPAFEELLPGLPNQHVRLQKDLKAKYHALCVLSGNFSCLLWRKFFDSLEQDLNLPYSIGHSYLLQCTQNLLANHQTALTGPLVRNDMLSIEKNLVALKSDPFQDVYKSFVLCYQELKERGLA
jgi:predicted short-subunit dehydrogenase-like oxidoreductase (DUF2520 family)